MKTFQFNKLVRDKIPAEIQKDGGKMFSRKLSRQEFLGELIRKISEEAKELTAQLSQEKAVKELADVCEVISAIQKEFKISNSQLLTARRQKNKSRGAFTKRIFIDRVEVPNNYPWINHYRQNSGRYREIKNKRK